MSEPMLWLALANGVTCGFMFVWGRSVGRKENPWRRR